MIIGISIGNKSLSWPQCSHTSGLAELFQKVFLHSFLHQRVLHVIFFLNLNEIIAPRQIFAKHQLVLGLIFWHRLISSSRCCSFIFQLISPFFLSDLYGPKHAGIFLGFQKVRIIEASPNLPNKPRHLEIVHLS